MSKPKLCLGVDIGTQALKICKLKPAKNSYTLEMFAYSELPESQGNLDNPETLDYIITTIKHLLKLHNVREKQTAISISGHAVIIKKLSLPYMTAKELENTKEWEAAQFIPFDIKDVYLDMQILNKNAKEQSQMEVMLVAAKKEAVNSYLNIIRNCDLEPVICDVDALSMEILYNHLQTHDQKMRDKTVILINIGAKKTNINIVNEGLSAFTRDLNIGGYDFTEAIHKELKLSLEDAEELKKNAFTSRKAFAQREQLQEIVQRIANSLSHEIQRSIDFYNASYADTNPTKIWLMGGGAKLPVLPPLLEHLLNIPVGVLNPFSSLHIPHKQKRFIENIGPEAAIAIGLAMRYPGDN